MYDLYYRTQEGVVFVGVVVQREGDGAGAIDIFNVGSVNTDQIKINGNTNTNANNNANANNMIGKTDRVLSSI